MNPVWDETWLDIVNDIRAPVWPLDGNQAGIVDSHKEAFRHLLSNERILFEEDCVGDRIHTGQYKILDLVYIEIDSLIKHINCEHILVQSALELITVEEDDSQFATDIPCIHINKVQQALRLNFTRASHLSCQVAHRLWFLQGERGPQTRVL